MALELGLQATIKNGMADTLVLRSHTIDQPGAVWVQAPPAQIAGNSSVSFNAAAAGAAVLSGTVVYRPEHSGTDMTLTFTVNGQSNSAQASYPMIGPTVGAHITQGANASATYTYER